MNVENLDLENEIEIEEDIEHVDEGDIAEHRKIFFPAMSRFADVAYELN